MTLNEILKRLDLKLGMKVIDTKPSNLIKHENHIYTLIKKEHDTLVFKNSDGWFFQLLYVLTQLGKRFKVVENE